MQAIHPTQGLNQQGDAVVNLHAALDTLGFGDPITQQERADHRYGDGTTVAVRALQHDLGVHTEQHGVVDEPTAEAINRRLFELGVFHRVEGTLRLPDGGPSADTLIFAFDPEFIGGPQLGEATTSDNGFYRIFYDPTLHTRLGPGVDHISVREAQHGRSVGQIQGRENFQDALTLNEFDPNQPAHVRGWLRNERRAVEFGNISQPRIPKGYVMGHGPTTPAREGFGYYSSKLTFKDINDVQEGISRLFR